MPRFKGASSFQAVEPQSIDQASVDEVQAHLPDFKREGVLPPLASRSFAKF
jgi:hypothetical protein